MDKLVITPPHRVSDQDLAGSGLGARFARMDLLSQLALLAVEPLMQPLENWPRDRTGICLGTGVGCLSTDLEYWKERGKVGGPSPTLFTYTLPSAALGEIAIRHKLMGPNLCFIGDNVALLHEAGQLVLGGEAEACLCVYCEWISAAAADIVGGLVTAQAWASLLHRQKAP
jgi:3-oxoacyl-(acyl-carrier-protein) synthase